LDDKEFMQLALKEASKALAKDEVPIGAVLVFNGMVIAKAHNQVETKRNAMAHAESIVLTKAMKKLGVKWLYDTTLYVTVEPCSMCAGAALLARISRLVIGTKSDKAGACGTVLNIVEDKRFNHQISVEFGVEESECKAILQAFFQQKRKS